MASLSPPEVLVLDRAAVRAVDRAAIDEYGLPGIVLMENAARALAREALTMLPRAGADGATVLIVCGSGNNGGDGWALSRHLDNAGVRVAVAALGEPRSGTDAAVHRAVAARMGLREIPIEPLEDLPPADLLVDALFGTGLDRPIAGRALPLIEWINAGGRRVLAVDVPSGLDCDTGQPLGAAVHAARTVTFVAAKAGFSTPAARPYVGEIVIGDIGVPRALVERFGRRR